MIPYYTLAVIHIGPLTLNVWGLFAGLAFAAALFIALKEAKRKNINDDNIFDLAILILAGGVIGARLAFILENWDYFSQNTNEILSLKEGGLMFLGGALGAILLAGAYLKLKKVNGWNIIDGLVPSFAIGEFIGRIGCSLADLHIGTITTLPWAQEYADGTARHPIAIYMALNGLAMFIVFWFLRAKVKIEGALFLFFVLWYSGTRFFLDFLRCSDLEVCDPRYSGYTPSQYISAGVFIISLIYLINIFKNPSSGGKKHMAEQQNDKEENKNLQGSVVSYTEVEEVVFESKTDGAESGGGVAGSAVWKEKISAMAKKPWAIPAALIIILAIGAISASIYYNSFFYGKMFKNPPFYFQGKTWVSTDSPIVALKIVNDKNCAKCDTSDFVNQVKNGIIPTLSVQTIDYNSAEGKKLIEEFNVKSLPAFFFDTNIEKVAVYEKVKDGLEKKDNLYYLSPAASGIPPGKFLNPLQVLPTDRVKGPLDAPVAIIEFSDFQCPYCKVASEAAKQVLAAYPDKIKFAYKELPLSIHANAEYAAEVAECAGDQGKFWEMHDLLFANQEAFSKDTPDQFKVTAGKYANQLKLDKKTFDDCLYVGKYKSKIEADSKLAADYGVSGTPAFFINGQMMTDQPTVDNFKKTIDELLKK